MKKRIIALLFLAVMGLQLAACSLEPTCKASGCDETDIYKDGYCKYHYYKNAGEDFLKGLFN